MKYRFAFWWVIALSVLGLMARAAEPRIGRLPQGNASRAPEYAVIDKWRGTWDVRAMRHQPTPAREVTYVETYHWVLDRRFLLSETTRKSDGGKSMSVVWPDAQTKRYRFVIFDSNGIAVEMPPPTWNESTQTMEWKASMLDPVSYTGYVKFTDPDTMKWKALLKDWKGDVLLDLEGTSVRRTD